MKDSSIIYKNVTLGKNSKVEHFCILGISNRSNPLPLVIGNNAVIRSGTYIYEGNIIGNNFQTGNKVNIREENKIGDNVSIGTHTIIEHHVNIEDDVRIHSSAFIPEYSVLKEECWIGPMVTFTNAKYPKSANVKENLQGPIIGKKAKIGAGSIVLPGIEIGENSLIGAGTLVNKNIPKDSVVVGNPCKIIRKIDELPDNPYSGL